VQIPADERAYSIVALNDALEQLESLDKRQAKIVEMRFFGGMSTKEISEVFDISERTVSREWASARLWLFRELKKT
ncbi:MAG: sigma-70 family RNA polymerase sigma factor, partial [Pyrinomonadaceae bacterium]|nr:sigma-70 family RNA polymerase sigma factor [Pyrinomonadaceae bacterium]